MANQINVFKFGGASVKDAEAVRNVANILRRYPDRKLMVIISAMGKTTNALERLLQVVNKPSERNRELLFIYDFHHNIVTELFDDNAKFPEEFDDIFNAFGKFLDSLMFDDEDFAYDQVVSFGEVLSTLIISNYLDHAGIQNKWLDARELIATDNTYREAVVDWITTEKAIREGVLPRFEEMNVCISQGFIGYCQQGFTTTLGREGSDFSAAIFAYALDAQDVTIWKDVPGMLNADPKWFDDTKRLDKISYREAIELSYYGATVIHPKTLKPLQNKSIPLYVKSFLRPEERGSEIQKSTVSDALIPSFIFKMEQVLISITPRDFSFIVEENISQLYGIFAQHGVKINLMQNSALNFSVCVDYDAKKFEHLIAALQENYNVLYNSDLELVTIRHYDSDTINRVTKGKEILVEQRSRQTARMVMREGKEQA